MQSAIHSRGLSPRHVGQRGNYVRDGDVLLTHGSGRSGKCRTCHLRWLPEDQSAGADRARMGILRHRAETTMPEHDAGDTLARLLLPYRRRFRRGRGPL